MPLPDKVAAVALLRNIGALLEYRGENTFKVRAYENAARALAGEPGSFEEILSDPARLLTIKGIGKAIAEVLREYGTTGRSSYLEELARDAPTGIAGLLEVPRLGIKKIKLLHEKLGINTVEELADAARSGRLSTIPGFGKGAGDKVLASLDQMQRFSGLILMSHALKIAAPLLDEVRSWPEIIRAEIAGSLRRRREVVGNLDFVASTKRPEEVARRFSELPQVTQVLGQRAERVSVLLDRGIQADLRIVADTAFIFSLHYFTGSKEHNVQLRSRAEKKGYLLNEDGLFRTGGKKPTSAGVRDEQGSQENRVDLQAEASLYAELGLQYIEPEMREAMGEIEAAARKKPLPGLVNWSDYRGVLHCHTTWSDGANTIREMALAARDDLNLQYFGVCDHSELASYAGGIKKADVPRQHAEIDEVNRELGGTGFRVLKGCECDILADGTLDYPDEILATMDFVVASVHSRFRLSAEEMTSRLIRAVESPYTTILGHLSGRLLLSREPYEFDMEAVLKRAGETGTLIEINADPHRLDLDWRFCRRARELGVQFAINPDAHSIANYEFLHYGIAMARKGWLSPEDVVNCLSLEEFLLKCRGIRNQKLRKQAT